MLFAHWDRDVIETNEGISPRIAIKDRMNNTVLDTELLVKYDKCVLCVLFYLPAHSTFQQNIYALTPCKAYTC